MALNEKKYSYGLDHALRDTRPLGIRLADWLATPENAGLTFMMLGFSGLFFDEGLMLIDFILILSFLYIWWLTKRGTELAHKAPASSDLKSDPNNVGGSRSAKPEGILYLGNTKDNSNGEIWFTNDDIRTHFLYLGTTGAGKTEGLKSLVSNSLCWGSGFIYIDGKADTDLWSSLSSLCRRFGRDDDLMVLNYMTGNSDVPAPSNTLNPFSSGSAGYLTNMLVTLMPEAGGDNAMWKERAVSLLGSLMPALTWLRDHRDVHLSISKVRQALSFAEIIKLSRNQDLPDKRRDALKDYLNELPGYVDAAFDDDGKEKPMGPDVPQTDTQVPIQQHGYLTMQFTRSLQSLADDYGYIFDVDNADIDMVDIVLNRRILVVLIPALEKSGDEIANLGKIISATLKGMMGMTLGATVEGESSKVIENKPTNSSTPFMTVFDEVGYYVTDGMAVMAAQARSLGFSLVYAAQDLSALEKRVKEEARSITANCNIKIFGKLSDPGTTKKFFEDTLGKAIVSQVSGHKMNMGSLSGGFETQDSASLTFYDKIDYGSAQEFKEGVAALAYSNVVDEVQIFYCASEKAKAMRVQRMLGLKKTDGYILKNLKNITALRDRLVHKTWTATNADVSQKKDDRMDLVIAGLQSATENDLSAIEQGAMALTHLYTTENPDALQVKDNKPVEEPNEKADTASNISWSDIMSSPSEEKQDEDEKESGSSSKSVSPSDFDVEEAIQEKAESGMTILPENLSEDVQKILKDAAETLTAGLFTPPSLDRYSQGGAGDNKGFKAKNISPVQKPGQGGGGGM
jgi:intracellular multiplication protein IcmO